MALPSTPSLAHPGPDVLDQPLLVKAKSGGKRQCPREIPDLECHKPQKQRDSAAMLGTNASPQALSDFWASAKKILLKPKVYKKLIEWSGSPVTQRNYNSTCRQTWNIIGSSRDDHLLKSKSFLPGLWMLEAGQCRWQ